MEFSDIFRWSKQKRNGTLVTSFVKDNENLDVDEQDNDQEENGEDIDYDYEDDDDGEDISLDIQEIAEDLATDLNIGDWVAITYERRWYPGIIQKVQQLATFLSS